jgi:hypothetical protein
MATPRRRADHGRRTRPADSSAVRIALRRIRGRTAAFDEPVTCTPGLRRRWWSRRSPDAARAGTCSLTDAADAHRSSDAGRRRVCGGSQLRSHRVLSAEWPSPCRRVALTEGRAVTQRSRSSGGSSAASHDAVCQTDALVTHFLAAADERRWNGPCASLSRCLMRG